MTLRQDRVLGALLGMGIGDALGMPVEGWPREHVAERYGSIDRYYPRTFEDGAELAAGEFTDDSEGALCIVESYTAATGELDPENILARLEILARGEARRWMNPSTYEALTAEGGDRSRFPVTGDVAVRGVPLGLIAAGRRQDPAGLIESGARLLGSMTHTDPLAWQSIALVAEAVRLTSAGEADSRSLPSILQTPQWSGPFAPGLETLQAAIESGAAYDDIVEGIGFGDGVVPVVLSAIGAWAMAQDFEHGVFAAASAGGAADSRGAVAGALLGGQQGTGGIPQALIDGLEGRMYIMLAAPWFLQTIQLKSSFWRPGT